MPDRVWRVSVNVMAPTGVKPAPLGGLPEQLEFESRLPEQARRYGDLSVAVRKVPDDGGVAAMYGGNPQVEVVQLITEVAAAGEAIDAVQQTAPRINAIIDLMSFEMAAPLQVLQVVAHDVTPPLTVGEDRQFSLFASPPLDRHVRSTDMGTMQGLARGRLPESSELQDAKVAAALRWFVRTLGTDLLNDQFIFLWIALEILRDKAGFMVEEPTRLRCQHTITNCPVCEKPTAQMRFGATMRTFLVNRGVDPASATEMWTARQVVHGAARSDAGSASALAPLVQMLRWVVATDLKTHLGIGESEPPVVAPAGLSIGAMGIGGTRKISAQDLEPLVPAC